MKKTTALLALGITLLALPIVRAQGTSRLGLKTQMS